VKLKFLALLLLLSGCRCPAPQQRPDSAYEREIRAVEFERYGVQR